MPSRDCGLKANRYGQRFSAVEWELSELSRRPADGAAGASEAARGRPTTADQSEPTAGLEQAWAAFESQQELEELRRRLQL